MTKPIEITAKDILRIVKDGSQIGFVFKSHSHKDNNTVWANKVSGHWRYTCDCGAFIFNDFTRCPHIKVVGEVIRHKNFEKLKSTP
jgi:hypothetical protein